MSIIILPLTRASQYENTTIGVHSITISLLSRGSLRIIPFSDDLQPMMSKDLTLDCRFLKYSAKLKERNFAVESRRCFGLFDICGKMLCVSWGRQKSEAERTVSKHGNNSKQNSVQFCSVLFMSHSRKFFTL